MWKNTKEEHKQCQYGPRHANVANHRDEPYNQLLGGDKFKGALKGIESKTEQTETEEEACRAKNMTKKDRMVKKLWSQQRQERNRGKCEGVHGKYTKLVKEWLEPTIGRRARNTAGMSERDERKFHAPGRNRMGEGGGSDPATSTKVQWTQVA